MASPTADADADANNIHMMGVAPPPPHSSSTSLVNLHGSLLEEDGEDDVPQELCEPHGGGILQKKPSPPKDPRSSSVKSKKNKHPKLKRIKSDADIKESAPAIASPSREKVMLQRITSEPPRADACRWGLRDADARADAADVTVELELGDVNATTQQRVESDDGNADADVWQELAVAMETGGVALAQFAYASADARGRIPASRAVRAVVDAFAAATGDQLESDMLIALSSAVMRLAKTQRRKSKPPLRYVSAEALLDRAAFAQTAAGQRAASKARSQRERRREAASHTASVAPLVEPAPSSRGSPHKIAMPPAPEEPRRKLRRRYGWRECFGCWPLYDICILPGEIRDKTTDLFDEVRDPRAYE